MSRIQILENRLQLLEDRLPAIDARLDAGDARDARLVLLENVVGDLLPMPPQPLVPNCVCESQDSYSFLSEGRRSRLFWIGIFVFVFQIFGILILILSMTHRLGESSTDTFDNPSKTDDFNITDYKTFLATFIPTNNSTMVKITQSFAALAFCFFRNSITDDMMNSVDLISACFCRQYKTGLFGAILRFLQGWLSAIATIILIMTLADAKDIFLSVTAVTYISDFDEIAFQMVSEGWFGEPLKKEAGDLNLEPGEIFQVVHRVGPLKNKIQNLTAEKISNEYKYRTFGAFCKSTILIVLTFLVVIVPIFVWQHDYEIWSTRSFSVTFDKSSNLYNYSGCFFSMNATNDHKRVIYESFTEGSGRQNQSDAYFAYCREEQQWVMLENNIFIEDPCKLTNGDGVLGRSSSTLAFDISTDFKNQWRGTLDNDVKLKFDTKNFFCGPST